MVTSALVAPGSMALTDRTASLVLGVINCFTVHKALDLSFPREAAPKGLYFTDEETEVYGGEWLACK